MTGEQLAAIRLKLGERTQEQMAKLLGVSLVGLKRFETDKRPIPAYIAVSVRAIELCHKQGLLPLLEKLLKKRL